MNGAGAAIGCVCGIALTLLTQHAQPRVLEWGGDAEGGAPFVEADPADPSTVRGFDVEVAARIAGGLGRRAARFVQVQWANIDQSVQRGDFILGLSGVEDTPVRRARHAVTLPYFEFQEVLAVRAEDRDRIRGLRDLRGRRVGTLGATIAYDLLISARDSIDAVLREAMRDGSLEQIFRRWQVWDDRQGALFERVLRPVTAGQHGDVVAAPAGALAYLPSLARAAAITLLLSVLSMALAVLVGLVLASGRLYGPLPLRILTTVYIELIRGTPLLLQLFVIYYGLAGVVRLPAFLAALLAVGLNYAAYEAEIYRGALEAVPRAQLEAGRTLGLSEAQILRLVRVPQALRYALAPMTNDFVALLKDSSLVSVITVVELTKQTAIYATNVGSWVVPGLLCAVVYLAMSLPLSRLARRLERRWGGRTP
jgi:polar amino acid transport system substrate-binding protein